MIRALLPLLLPLSAQDDSATRPAAVEVEPPPMEALARLCEGVWRADVEGAPPSYQFYGWGAGRRSIRSGTVLPNAQGPRVIGEGIWFHDPARDVYRIVGFASWGRVHARMTIEGETWTQRYTLWTGNRARSMADDWVWHDATRGTYVSRAVEGEEERPYQEAGFRRATRPEEEPTLDLEPRAGAGPLEPLAFLVGGEWELDTTWPDGTRFHVSDEHRWGVRKLCIWKRAWRFEEDGSRVATIDGVYYADPDPESDELLFLAVSAEGALYEGTISPGEDTLVFEYTSTAPNERPMRLRERLDIEEDAIRMALWRIEGDQEREIMSDVVAKRREREPR